MKEPNMTIIQNRHLSFGWKMLFFFLLLGLTLETLHGFKVDWYLEFNSETRRFLWTLAHAHGALLALVNLCFALTLSTQENFDSKKVAWISPTLLAASVLLPVGFFLGGIVVYQGDPGAGILLAPVGAVLLLIAVGLVAVQKFR